VIGALADALIILIELEKALLCCFGRAAHVMRVR
jgi:hypothetical protein